MPHVFGRWEDLLERAKPDIVVIATPPHLHEAIALRAFAGGAHVLCEKPVAMDRRQAGRMVDAARRAGRVAMTGFNWRFIPAMQRFHAMVSEGAVGRVFHLDARWLGARWADEAVKPTWRMDRAQAGHGAMGDVGVHLIDLVRWSFGDVRRVVAQAGVAYPDRRVPDGTRAADADDFATVIAELASGALATLAVSRVARGANAQTIEAYGTAGSLVYTMDRDQARWFDGQLRATRAGGAPAAVDLGALASFGDKDPMEVTGLATIAPLVETMLASIRTGAPASPSLEDGLRAQAVLDAIVESRSRGGWVEV